MLRLNMKKRSRRREINREIKDDLSIVCGLTPAPPKSLQTCKKSILRHSTPTPSRKIRCYDGNIRIGRVVDRDSFVPNPITKEFSVMQIIDMICESKSSTPSSFPNSFDPFGTITPSTGRTTVSELITPRRVFTDKTNISSGPSFFQTPRLPERPKPKKSVTFLTDSSNNIEVQKFVFDPFSKIIPGPDSQLSGGSNSSVFDPFSNNIPGQNSQLSGGPNSPIFDPFSNNIPGPDLQLSGGSNSSSSPSVAATDLFMQSRENQGELNLSLSPINMVPLPEPSPSDFFSSGFQETHGLNLNFNPININKVPLPEYSTSDYFSGGFQETQGEVNFNFNPINIVPESEYSTSQYFSGGFQPSISMEF